MRTRRIPCVVAVMGFLVLPVDAMVTQTRRNPASVVGNEYSTLPRSTRPAESWTDAVLDDEDEYADDQDFLMDFMELQRSTGTEIPNEELQLQIDQATSSPDLFLDAHMQDASFMEKVAMSSIPQQLPRPAVTALSKKNKGSSSKSRVLDLIFAHGRVTPEQEVQLGKMIQRGVSLHKKKMDLEATLGREVTRQEWTDHVGLESPKELRRFVSEYRRAKQLLVTANMGLVHAVVKSQHSRKMGVAYEELVQEGSLGLLRAAELFDPSRGLRFSTYATIWIKGTLSNSHVVEPITLPQREKSKWNKIRKAHDDLATELDRDPTPQEICAHVDMNVEEFWTVKRKMTQAQRVLSLDYEYSAATRGGGTDGGSFAGLQNDRAFMADVDLAERAQLHADVVAALASNLDAREARLMRLRYGLADGQTRSLAECAEAMGLGQTRVQQIAQKCLKKLREAEEMSSLEEYLLTIA